MSKVNSIATLATVMALAASAASAGTRDIHKYGEFFQNVKAEHVQPLLGGTAYVVHMDYDGIGREDTTGGEVEIFWHTKDGKRITCGGTPSMGYPYEQGEYKYDGVNHTSKYLRTQFPIVEVQGKDGKIGQAHISYDASTGGITTYWYQKLRLWEMRTGHLQTELPAVTWELCPDFPSAKSLGARVNKKQTAKYYLDLIKQDPGTRVMKPEYEAKEPPIVRLDLDFQPMPGQDR